MPGEGGMEVETVLPKEKRAQEAHDGLSLVSADCLGFVAFSVS